MALGSHWGGNFHGKFRSSGFAGARSVVLPRDVVESALERDPFAAGLCVSDIGIYPLAARHRRVRPQGAKECILIVCRKGRGWVRANGLSRQIAPGEIISLAAHEAHEYGAADEDPWTILWMHFVGRDALSYARELPLQGAVLGGAPVVEQISRQMVRILDCLSLGYSRQQLAVVSHLAREVLATLAFGAFAGPPNAVKSGEAVERAVAWLGAQVSRPVSVAELSRVVGVSPSHLAAKFKAETGYSPIDYHIRLRMQRACQWLDHSELLIEEIAANLGYQDPFFFSRTFSRIMGCSPTSYRRQLKG